MLLVMLEDVLDDVTIPMALEHTGIAMGIVFLVLIVISGLIYLLKFVPELLSGDEKKALAQAQDELKKSAAKHTEQSERIRKYQEKKAAAMGTPAKRSGSVPAAGAGNDAQLVAVIMAAIAAQMAEETGVFVAVDGLVIRSIKKRN